MITLADASQDSSKLTLMADEQRTVVIFEDNMPKHAVLSSEQVTGLCRTNDDELGAVAGRILKANLNAFEKMAES